VGICRCGNGWLLRVGLFHLFPDAILTGYLGFSFILFFLVFMTGCIDFQWNYWHCDRLDIDPGLLLNCQISLLLSRNKNDEISKWNLHTICLCFGVSHWWHYEMTLLISYFFCSFDNKIAVRTVCKL